MTTSRSKKNNAILVLYAGGDWKRKIPNFPTLAHAYAEWGYILRKQGMRLTRGSSEWFSNGAFQRYWELGKDGVWKKVSGRLVPIAIEDRSRDHHPVTGEYIGETFLKKLEINKRVPMLNVPEFNDLVSNKLNQAVMFHKFMPKTDLIMPGTVIKNPSGKRLVLKALGGYGGDYVEVTNKKRIKVETLKLQQQFIKASQKGVLRDFRIVYFGDKPQYGLTRTAPKGSFITNIHLGGGFEHIPLKKLGKLVEYGKEINKPLQVFPKRICSFDYMYDAKTKKPYLIEINAKPTIETLTGKLLTRYFTNFTKYILS